MSRFQPPIWMPPAPRRLVGAAFAATLLSGAVLADVVSVPVITTRSMA